MLLFEKIDMFLLGEAKSGIKLTPLALSMIKSVKGWTREQLDALVSDITPKIKDNNIYEITFDRSDKGEKTALLIYRKSDDVVKRKITPDVHQEYKSTVSGFLKGTDLKISGESKVADWLAFKVG
jgi:hypothetical protein